MEDEIKLFKDKLDNYSMSDGYANSDIVNDIDMGNMREITQSVNNPFHKINYLIIPIIEKLHRAIGGEEFRDLAEDIREICISNIEKEK